MSIRSADALQQNHILAALAPTDLARFARALDPVELRPEEILCHAGAPVGAVYFPVSGVVSKILPAPDGIDVELALTGSDGIVGISLVLGDLSAAHRCVVLSPGMAYRLSAEAMRWELDQGGTLLRQCLRYAQSLMIQMAQITRCSRAHPADQQLCRWILLNLDYLAGAELSATQEQIAYRLGLRRTTVTESARRLQAEGLIRYSRGRIVVEDRPGLEARACDCYSNFKREQARLEAEQIMPRGAAKAAVRANPATLRGLAEARARQARARPQDTPRDTLRLVHELEVNQVECELQIDELRRAYDEADALRRRYADLYDFAPVGFFTLDAAGTIIELNLAGAILLGIKRSEHGLHKFVDTVSPEDQALVARFVDDVLHSRSIRICEVHLPATAMRPAAIVRVEAVSDEEGQECRMVVVDVSRERFAEQAMRKREHYQRALLDSFPFMVWLKDGDSRFLAVNAALARNFGFSSANELVGKTDFDITSQELAAAYRADDQAVLQSGDSKSVKELIESEGKARWFETYKSPVVIDEERVGTVGYARDITARHDAETALRHSERRYRQLIDRLPLGVFILQRGLIKLVNPAACRMIGRDAKACLEQAFSSLIHEDDRPRVQQLDRQQLRGETIEKAEDIRILGRAGQTLECWIHLDLVDWDGQPAVIAIIQDVSDYKRLEAELRSLASIDLLTGLANRRSFMARLKEAHSRLRRDRNQRITLLILDLDHFKQINDRFGDAAGDDILRRVSTVLRKELRQGDIGGRIGGEEFAILLPDTDLEAATVFADRVRMKVGEATAVTQGPGANVTVSIGIAAMQAADGRPEDVLGHADRALYRAKVAGRNRIECFAAPLE